MDEKMLDIIVPDDLDEAEECVIVTWLKRVNDTINLDEVLVILQAAKVSFEIVAPAAGRVTELLAEQGAVVKERQVIARIAVTKSVTEPITAPQPATPSAPTANAIPSEVRASPIAKRIAREQGIDLSQVTGSGADGRIQEKDVLAYVEAQQNRSDEGNAAPPAASPTPQREVRASPVAKRLAKEHGVDLTQVTGSGSGGRIQEKDVLDFIESAKSSTGSAPSPEASPKTAPQALSEPAPIPFSPMRSTIARHMTASLQGSAQLTLTTNVDVTALVAMRAALKQRFTLSYTDMLVKAVTIALVKHPSLNAWVVEGEGGLALQISTAAHIGMAVALDEGLIVPVIHNAENKSLPQIAQASARLAQQARTGTLSPNGASGGTFTITNLGMYGIDAFTPILNPPEVAILGVGRIRDELTRDNHDMRWRQMMMLSLTIDHRAVDGAPGALFLQTLTELLAAPAWAE